jgi:hypothetical protein
MLLSGPVRAYEDHKAECIVIETTKENLAGAGLVVCTLKMDRVSDARLIKALPALLRTAEPFAALGRELEKGDPDAPLITNTAVKLEITVGDLQRIAVACARALAPVLEIPDGTQLRRGSGKKARPKPPR